MKIFEYIVVIASLRATLGAPAPDRKSAPHPMRHMDIRRANDLPDLPEVISFNGDPFTSVDTSEPYSVFPKREHPLQPAVQWGNGPIQTNKFYGNMLIDDQSLSVWTHPYELWKTPDGIAVGQIRSSQRVFGYNPGQSSAHYMINPTGIISVEFGANEINGGEFEFNVKDFATLSATAELSVGGGRMSVPMTLGMGFVTAVYEGLTPKLTSMVGFQTLNEVSSPSRGVRKYEIGLFDGITWVAYLSSDSGNTPELSLDNGSITARETVSNLVVQIASLGENNKTSASQVYDASAGRYITSAEVKAEISGGGAIGSYTLAYTSNGTSTSGNTLVFALPHHVDSFSSNTAAMAQKGLSLTSTVFGNMTAVLTNSVTMEEREIPQTIGFMPWGESKGLDGNNDFNAVAYSADVLAVLRNTTSYELLGVDMASQIIVDSVYYAGKVLDRFALLAFTALLAGDYETAKQGLSQLIAQYNVFKNNQQQVPLVYDMTWRGIISSAGLSGDANADFGSTYYSDHHFHYGYLVHSAAVIGALDNIIGDGQFVESVKPFVNTLIRDVANPSAEDGYFPVFRCFDWFSGKSWAKGLFASGDGKDEESSSEDYHFAYGMKLWGRLIGDGAMQSRGDLMLAVMRRSMNSYMLFSTDNKVMPPELIGNKVSGIIFENKIDYATYFGLNTEYIHGIHMIPFTPISNYVRKSSFCKQEWDAKLASVVGSVNGGWKGVVEMDQMFFSPQDAVNWLVGDQFDYSQLDGGMSRGWSLALASALTV